MFKEFKKFISRGNVVDLAIGIIIGGAFGQIVTSFVNDLLMPIISLLIGNSNFSELSIILKEGSEEVAPISIKYGNFIQVIINFLIISFSIFLMVKFINSMKERNAKEVEEAKPAAPVITNEEKLLAEIRDILKKN